MPSQKRKLGDTKRQREAKVARTFGPIYKFIRDMREDSVDCVQGYPMIWAWGEHMLAGHALIGFVGCVARLSPTLSVKPITSVAAKLDAGVPITLEEVAAMEVAVRAAEQVYRNLPIRTIKDAILTEQIAIELSQMGGACDVQSSRV